MDDTRSLTKQLQSFSGGDREIAEVILREVLPTLHQIAVRELRRERYIAPLSPTELINEVWLRSLRKAAGKSTAANIFTRLRHWPCAECWLTSPGKDWHSAAVMATSHIRWKRHFRSKVETNAPTPVTRKASSG